MNRSVVNAGLLALIFVPALAFVLATQPAAALDNSLAALKNSAVTCTASGTTPARLPAAATSASSFMIVNASTDCVRVGGVGVTASTGASVGTGCTLGPSLVVDAQVGWCISDDATPVAVQLLFGVKQ